MKYINFSIKHPWIYLTTIKLSKEKYILSVYNLKKSQVIITDFDKDKFLKWLKWRISYYFFKIGKKPFASISSFKDIFKNHKLFVGQILYRAFYDKRMFEIYRSKYLYSIWEKNKIIVPIYPIVPKGEMGINPNLDKLGIKYKIYKVKIFKNKITMGNEIQVNISPKNISKQKCAIR